MAIGKKATEKNKKRYIVILVLLMVAALAGLNHGISSFFSGLLMEPTDLGKERLYAPAHYLRQFFQDLSSFRQLRTENRKLRIEVSELRRQLNLYREASLENARLKRLLRMKNAVKEQFVVARVVGYDLTPWVSMVELDKGLNHGVVPDAVVLAGSGVAGRILNTSLHYSRVMLIADKNSRIPAIVQRSRVRGIVEGAGQNGCTLSFVEKGADVAVGDSVVTSGEGGVFPKGLLLGRITKIEKDGHIGDLFQYIQVEPEVDLSRLEELLILIRKQPILGD